MKMFALLISLFLALNIAAQDKLTTGTAAKNSQLNTPRCARVQQRILKLTAVQLHVPRSKVKLQSRIVADLGGDDLAVIEMTSAVEDEFRIEIPDDEAEKLKTVQQYVDYINTRLDCTQSSTPASAVR